MNRVTKESIEKKITNIAYIRLSPKITHCTITMQNGFEVTGESAVVDPENYNKEIGQKIAYDNAFDKLWVVEGYLLQEKIHLKKNFEAKMKEGFFIHLDEALLYECHEEEHNKKISDVMYGSDFDIEKKGNDFNVIQGKSRNTDIIK